MKFVLNCERIELFWGENSSFVFEIDEWWWYTSISTPKDGPRDSNRILFKSCLLCFDDMDHWPKRVCRVWANRLMAISLRLHEKTTFKTVWKNVSYLQCESLTHTYTHTCIHTLSRIHHKRNQSSRHSRHKFNHPILPPNSICFHFTLKSRLSS